MTRTPRPARAVAGPPAAAVAGLLALTGCGSPSAAPAASSAGGVVTVLAASSMAGPVQAVAAAVEKAHPGLTVRVTTGGSSDLVAQLAGGLPADVLVTADTRTMTGAADQHLVTGPVRVATNRLTLVTAPGNPLRIASLDDAGRHALVVCAPPVPCGAATRAVAQRSGATVHAVSEEPNVTAVLEKVTSGQADAGVVYVTDARRAGGAVATVPLPGADGVVTTVMAAATPTASAAGREVLATLTGATGRAALDAAGFGRP